MNPLVFYYSSVRQQIRADTHIQAYTHTYTQTNYCSPRCACAPRVNEWQSYYRIAGNFRGVLIFVIFVTIPRVTKFSTHEIFHPRIFSRLLRIGLRESRNLKPRKLILKTCDSFSRKFAPPKITRYTVC